MLGNSKLKRRAVTIPAVFFAAVVLLLLIPIWLVLAVAFDVVRLRKRLPTARLMTFALWWAWLEVAGIAGSAGLFVIGQAGNQTLHYRFQRWWAKQLLIALKTTTGLSITCENAALLQPGPVILLTRHASLADSLVTASTVLEAGCVPRFVLKRDLISDPCLDIFGHRLPNYFLNREATDTTKELASITALSGGMASNTVAIIFPEGTRSNDQKRQRAIEKIGERDPDRAVKVASLQHLLPPRPAGTIALMAGAPDADVVIAWHVGFDGLDTFSGILSHLKSTPPPVRFVLRRIDRSTVPSEPDALAAWLDDVWLDSDRFVHQALAAQPKSKDQK